MTGTDPAPAGLTLANWDLGGEPSAWAYLHAGDLFPHVEIPPVRPVARLPVAESGEVAKFAVEAGLTLDEYVGTAPVSGIVIVHRGRTAYERYPRMRPEDRHLLMSVTKLFPAVLVGILERRGMVDLGQPVDAVIGELAGAGWAGVPIGDILSMASGTDCLEVDDPAAYTDPDHPFYRFEASLGWRPASGAAPSTYDLVAALPARRPPGEAYEYTSVNTFVLSWLVERLTGLGFAEVVATGRSGAGLSRWGLRRLPGRRLVALLARLDRPIPDLGQRLLLDQGRHGWWYAIGDGTATTLGYCTTAGSCPLAPAGSRPPGRRPAGPPATGCPTLPGALRCGYARPPPARPTGPGPRGSRRSGTPPCGSRGIRLGPYRFIMVTPDTWPGCPPVPPSPGAVHETGTNELALALRQRTVAVAKLSAAAMLVAAAVVAAPNLAWSALVPKTPPLSTPWTSQVSTTNPLPDYPRPQLTRPDWQSLNGQWQFAGTGSLGSPPVGQNLPETVLVPYPIESALSGIMRHENMMWYRRTFPVPSGWSGRPVQPNFGAVNG